LAILFYKGLPNRQAFIFQTQRKIFPAVRRQEASFACRQGHRKIDSQTIKPVAFYKKIAVSISD